MEESRFTLNGALLLLRRRPDDGRDRRAPPGVWWRAPADLPGVTSAVSRAGSARRRWRRLSKLADEAAPEAKLVIFRRRESSVLPVWRAAADQPQADRQFSGLRTRAAEGQHAHRRRSKRDEIRSAIERVAQFSDERSRAIRVQFTAGEVKDLLSSVGNRRERRERPSEYDGPGSRDRIQRAVPARFSARRSAGRRWRLSSRIRTAPANCGPAGEAKRIKYRYVVMPMRI